MRNGEEGVNLKIMFDAILEHIPGSKGPRDDLFKFSGMGGTLDYERIAGHVLAIELFVSAHAVGTANEVAHRQAP